VKCSKKYSEQSRTKRAIFIGEQREEYYSTRVAFWRENQIFGTKFVDKIEDNKTISKSFETFICEATAILVNIT
jgi:hypothetical protein